MKLQIVTTVVAVVISAGLGAADRPPDAPARSGERAWGFDQNAPDRPPPGWTPGFTHPEKGDATWLVTGDPKAAGGPHVLRLTARSDIRTYNLITADHARYDDVDVKVTLRADTGQIDQGGGVIWRYQDANTYYICRVNPLESNFRVYHVVNGKRTQLASADVKTDAGRWCTVRARMIGDHIECFLDGKRLLDVRDGAIKAPGMIGLWTKADASTSFDNVAVQGGGRLSSSRPSTLAE